jgi:hypothetical protein
MHFLFFSIAVVAGIGYLVLEWRISDRALRSISRQEPVRLPGKKWNYLAATAGLSFLSALSFYLGLVTLFDAPIQLVCIASVVTVTLVSIVVNANSLKYVKFESKDEE